MAPAERLELVERDDAGNVTTTFIESAAGEGRTRVDAVVRPPSYATRMLRLTLTAAQREQRLCTAASRRFPSCGLSAHCNGRLHTVSNQLFF